MSGDNRLRLREVSPAHEAAYLDVMADFERAGEGYGWNDSETAKVVFAAFVRDLAAVARGEGLPPGVLAQTTYILLDTDGQALGELRLRPEPGYDLETLMAANGHMGYNVRLSVRGHGYTTRMLALARAEGLARVILPVNDENLASARVVERNGERLEQWVVDLEGRDVVQVYWIELA